MVFSIIIPTKDRPELLIEAIRSVQQQTFQDWEIIIVDDASSEATAAAVRPFVSGKIKYLRNETSLGPGGTRNRGILSASPESIFISLLDDDDTYYPEFLQKTYDAMVNSSDEIGFSWTGINNFYPSMQQQEAFFWDPPFRDRVQAFQGFLEKRLIGTGYGITIKKHVFEKVGYFDESLRAVEDTDFFLRMLKFFFYIKIPFVLVRITRADNNTDHVNTDSIERADALESIYKKHRESILRNAQAWYNFKRKISSIYYRLGNQKKAREILFAALQEKFSLRIIILWLKLEMTKR